MASDCVVDDVRDKPDVGVSVRDGLRVIDTVRDPVTSRDALPSDGDAVGDNDRDLVASGDVDLEIVMGLLRDGDCVNVIVLESDDVKGERDDSGVSVSVSVGDTDLDGDLDSDSTSVIVMVPNVKLAILV